MKKIFFLHLLILIAVNSESKSAPNFILIYADDLGYCQTSVPMFKGREELAHKLHRTPNIKNHVPFDFFLIKLVKTKPHPNHPVP